METTTKTLEWSELRAAMDLNPSLWIPTTKSMYYNMLGAVPPQDMAWGGFLVGEASDHNNKGEAVYSCFVEAGGECQAKYMTQREFNQWKTTRR